MHPSSRSANYRFVLFPAFLCVVCAFALGYVAQVAWADHWHTNCVTHGFVHGASNGDGSFFARVDPGCGSTGRTCSLYSSGGYVGGETVAGTTTTCNAWSRNFGNFTECASTAHVQASGIFSSHVHKAHNWCG